MVPAASFAPLRSLAAVVPNAVASVPAAASSCFRIVGPLRRYKAGGVDLDLTYVTDRYRSDAAKGTDNAAKGTDNAAKGTDNAAKGTDNAAKGTDIAVKGTDTAAKGTDTAAKGTDNAAEGTDNAAKGTDNAATGSVPTLPRSRPPAPGRFRAPRCVVPAQGLGYAAY